MAAALPDPDVKRPVPPLRKGFQAPPITRKNKLEKVEKLDRPAIRDDDGGMVASQEDYERVRTILEASVNQRIRDARIARESSGIEEIWAEDEDQYNGFDSLNGPAGQLVKTRDAAAKRTKISKQSRVFLNITKPKTDIATARVQEMLLPHDDKPWDVTPTPMPEMDEAQDMPKGVQVQLGDGTMAPAADVAALLKDRAAVKATKMADWIEDKFVEGSVYAEMRKVIRDAARLGSGVLKGPIRTMKTTRKWSVNGELATLQIDRVLSYTSRRIRVQDFYPAPDCGDNIHDGSYCVERDYLTARKLRELAEDPEYDQAAVAMALEEGPRRMTRGRNERRMDTPGDTFIDAELFEVYYYYGDVSPTDLIMLGLDNGVEAGKTRLTQEELIKPAIPSIVTILNGRAIKAVINPDETGEFPYDIFPWEPVDGQPWGRGVPRKIGTAQRGLNAAVRALLDNAGLSKGPLVVMMEGVEPVDGNYTVEGRKLFRFKATELVNDVQKAFASFDIPSRQEELSAIISFWLEMADQLSNLPLMLQGIAQAGTSPDTLGGMKLLLNSSTAPLRVIAKLFDDCLVVPHLRRYYNAGMQDPNCPKEAKGDQQIKAKGASVLVQREEGIEFLAMLFPVKDDPKLRISPAKLLREMARGKGLNITSIQYTDEEWKQEQERAAQQGAPEDPRIAAARIRNEGLQQQLEQRTAEAESERAARAAEGEAQRAHEERLSAVDERIQMMKLSGEENISLADIKAMLAGKAMDIRAKTDEMRLKLSPANPTNQGI